jgi:hypothetical protein
MSGIFNARPVGAGSGQVMDVDLTVKPQTMFVSRSTSRVP